MTESARQFDSGATRNSDVGKLAYSGFMSPLVLRRFGEFMDKHREQADGSLRAPDNWQKGIPVDAYQDSLIRHSIQTWLLARGATDVVNEHGSPVDLEEELCAILFNAMGWLYELLVESGGPRGV